MELMLLIAIVIFMWWFYRTQLEWSWKERNQQDGKLSHEFFEELLARYRSYLKKIPNNAIEIEKELSGFERAFPIGPWMLHFMGQFEHQPTRDAHCNPGWRYKTQGKQRFTRKKESFIFKYQKIRVIFSKIDKYAYDDDNATLEIFDNNKLVASYDCYRPKNAAYDWGEGNSRTRTRKFIPDEWLFTLNNLYLDWKNEHELLEKQEAQFTEEKIIKDKYQ